MEEFVVYLAFHQFLASVFSIYSFSSSFFLKKVQKSFFQFFPVSSTVLNPDYGTASSDNNNKHMGVLSLDGY